MQKESISILRGVELPHILSGDNETEYSVIGPGFTHLSIDRSGYVSIWEASRLREAFQLTAGYNRSPSKQSIPWMVRIFKECLIYTVSFRINILPAFYTVSIHLDQLIKFADRAANIGNTSYQHFYKVSSLATNEELFNGMNTFVSVDPETKSPIVIPWFKEQLSGTAAKIATSRVTKTAVPSDNAAVCFSVLPSDVDYYGHCNHSSYIRYCHDALSMLVIKGDIVGVTFDPALQQMDYIEGIYVAESKCGDKLCIKVWQTSNDKTFHFDASVEGGKKSVFQCIFVYSDKTLDKRM